MYRICGLFLFITYFFTRVLSFPYVYYIYAQQYHHGNAVSALYSLQWCCHLGTGLGLLFNMYWFIKIAHLMVKIFYEVVSTKEKKQ